MWAWLLGAWAAGVWLGMTGRGVLGGCPWAAPGLAGLAVMAGVGALVLAGWGRRAALPGVTGAAGAGVNGGTGVPASAARVASPGGAEIGAAGNGAISGAMITGPVWWLCLGAVLLAGMLRGAGEGRGLDREDLPERVSGLTCQARVVAGPFRHPDRWSWIVKVQRLDAGGGGALESNASPTAVSGLKASTSTTLAKQVDEEAVPPALPRGGFLALAEVSTASAGMGPWVGMGGRPTGTGGHPAGTGGGPAGMAGSLPPLPGDQVRLEGTLVRPDEARNPGAFSYRRYLAESRVLYILRGRPGARLQLERRARLPSALGLAFRLREEFHRVSALLLPPVQAALLQGIVLGDQGPMPRELLDSFRRTGTFHVLAASGMNVALAAGAVLLLGKLAGLGTRSSTLAALPAVWLYTLMAGGSPSVVRAAVMASAAMAALMVGRPTRALHALILAALILLVWHPLWLWDTSFQLSVLAVLGLHFLSPALSELMGRAPKLVSATASATLAAQLAVLPILAAQFHQLSLLGPLANLAVVPLAAFLLPSGLVGSALALLWLPLGWAPAAVNFLALQAMIRVVSFMGALPGSCLEVVTPPGWGVWMYYLGLALLLAAWQGRRAGGGGGGVVGPARAGTGAVGRGVGTAGNAGARAVGQVGVGIAGAGSAGPIGAGPACAEVTGPGTASAGRQSAGGGPLAGRFSGRGWLPAASGVLLMLAFLALVLLGRSLPGRAKDLQVVMLDVGEGDAIAVLLPGGEALLVDAGENRAGSGGAPDGRGPVAAGYGVRAADSAGARSSFDQGEKVVVPALRYLGVTRLKAVIISHSHPDHCGGMAAVIRSFPVGAVLAAQDTPGLEEMPGLAGAAAQAGGTGGGVGPEAGDLGPEPGDLAVEPSAGEAGSSRESKSANSQELAFKACLAEAVKRKIPVRLLREGDRFSLGRGLVLEALAPTLPALVGTDDDVNNHSLALRLAYGRVDLLFMGDLQAEGEEILCRDLGAGKLGRGLGAPGRITVLKAAHQGSKDSSGAPFLDLVQPRWALISVGRNNRYGHPHPLVLSRLREAGARVLRTDREGAITLSTDGERVKVETVLGR